MEQRALLYQIKDSHSRAIFTVNPLGSTEIDDEAFKTSIRICFGLKQLPAGFHCETHKAAIDTHAFHAICCQNFKEAVHASHNLIRDNLFALCQILNRNSEVKQCSTHLITKQLSLNDTKTKQLAFGLTILRDITVCLTRDAEARTFYNITVINTLHRSSSRDCSAKTGFGERRIGSPRRGIQQETQQTRRRRHKNWRLILSASPKRD